MLLEQGQPTRAEPLLSGLRPLAHVSGQTLPKASHVFRPQRPCSPILIFLSSIPSVLVFFFFFFLFLEYKETLTLYQNNFL